LRQIKERCRPAVRIPAGRLAIPHGAEAGKVAAFPARALDHEVARRTAMIEPRNRVVQIRGFGGPDQLEVVDAPMPAAGRGEVRVRVLASSVVYTDVTIRRHLYAQTMNLKPPFVLGYDVVGEIDQLGEGVTGFQPGDRVADMTVVGSNAAYRTLRARDLTRAPAGVDAAEAAALILSWTTAYQLLHRLARVQRGQRVLVEGAAGAVGQALLTLGRMAGLEMWGTARAEHAALVRGLGATPIDYQSEDFTRVLPGGFDVVFDGIAEDGCRRSLAALRPGGQLCAYGYTASVTPQRRLLPLLTQLARVYLWRSLLRWAPGGKRVRPYSINLMRARHPAWFREDLQRLFDLLATGAIRPRIAERISFEQVAEAHRRLEAGGLEGKLVLCPDLASRREGSAGKREPAVAFVRPTPIDASADRFDRIVRSPNS
jgi:NADPH:quinone reductase-like Zn-dependent oxidoreductase